MQTRFVARFVAALLALQLVGAVAFVRVGLAQESAIQMSLARSATFLYRLEYLMVSQARVVKAEALNTPCHAARTVYATNVIDNPKTYAATAAVMLVGGVNLIGTVIGNANPDLVDTSASDGALFSQVSTFWSALAKCDTGS